MKINGKWERLARELAANVRELEQLEQRTIALKRGRLELERRLREELEKEAAPLGPEVWQAEQDAQRLDPWAIGRPAPEKPKFAECFYCQRGLVHNHGVY